MVIANASLQGLTGHDALFPRPMALVAPGGVLAAQIPRNHHEPSHDCMRDAAAAGPWRDRLTGIEGLAPAAPVADINQRRSAPGTELPEPRAVPASATGD